MCNAVIRLDGLPRGVITSQSLFFACQSWHWDDDASLKKLCPCVRIVMKVKCSWSGLLRGTTVFKRNFYIAFVGAHFFKQLSINAFMSPSRALRKLRTFFLNRKISCRILQTHFVSSLLLHSFIASYSCSSLYRAPPCGCYWPRCRYYILLVIIKMIINNNLNWFLSNASLFIKLYLDSLTSLLIDVSYFHVQSVMSQAYKIAQFNCNKLTLDEDKISRNPTALKRLNVWVKHIIICGYFLYTLRDRGSSVSAWIEIKIEEVEEVENHQFRFCVLVCNWITFIFINEINYLNSLH